MIPRWVYWSVLTIDCLVLAAFGYVVWWSQVLVFWWTSG